MDKHIREELALHTLNFTVREPEGQKHLSIKRFIALYLGGEPKTAWLSFHSDSLLAPHEIVTKRSLYN